MTQVTTKYSHHDTVTQLTIPKLRYLDHFPILIILYTAGWRFNNAIEL